jgi:hypothetical protein
MYRIEKQPFGQHMTIQISPWSDALEYLKREARRMAEKDTTGTYFVCKENPGGCRTFALFRYVYVGV